MRKIACQYLLDDKGTLRQRGLVCFNDQGMVESVDFPENIDSIPGVEFHDGILIPGMTNAHCHLELSYLKGAIGEGGMLDGFVRDITQIRGQWTEQQQIDAAKLNDRFMWAEGVQAVGDISNGTASFPVKVESKIKYYTFAEYFNMPPDDEARAYFEEKTAHVAKARELGLLISPSPHSTYMVGDKMFKFAADSERLSIHFMETATEMGLFERKGGMYELLMEWDMEPDFLRYQSHPRRLVESLPSNIPLLLVHNTQCQEDDIKIVTNHFKDVSFALCPRSNYYIERAFPPARMFMDMGVNMAMGTDSLTSNHSLSMIEEIKWLSSHNTDIPLETILKWATIGGARALGFDGEIGSFAIGKHPGAVLVEKVDLVNLKTTSTTTSRRLL